MKSILSFPYKRGDIIQRQFHPRTYCEFIDYEWYQHYGLAPTLYFIVRYVKSRKGNPIVCRTRRTINSAQFVIREYENKRWISKGYVDPIN
jgi:hypothetical protein